MALVQHFGQLGHGHGVEERAVVAGDGVEVAGTDDVAGRVGAVGQVHQHQRLVGRQRQRAGDAGGAQVGDAQLGLRAAGQQRGGIGILGQRDGVIEVAVLLPAVDGQEACHAADGINRAVDQIDAAIAVEVGGIAADAAGHELRGADGTGVGAPGRQRIQAVLAAVQQELLKLLAEVGGARRKVEGQRGERLDGGELAGVATVEGFHADDGDDDLGGHTMFLRGALQCAGMLFPELQAAIDAHRLQEAGPVGWPVRQLGCRGGRGGGCACGRGVTGRGWHGGRRRRGRHQRQRARVGADLREQRQQGVAVETVALGHFAHEGLHVQMFGIVAGNGLGAAGCGSCTGSRCHGCRRGCRGGSLGRGFGDGLCPGRFPGGVAPGGASPGLRRRWLR